MSLTKEQLKGRIKHIAKMNRVGVDICGEHSNEFI